MQIVNNETQQLWTNHLVDIAHCNIKMVNDKRSCMRREVDEEKFRRKEHKQMTNLEEKLYSDKRQALTTWY